MPQFHDSPMDALRFIGYFESTGDHTQWDKDKYATAIAWRDSPEGQQWIKENPNHPQSVYKSYPRY